MKSGFPAFDLFSHHHQERSELLLWQLWNLLFFSDVLILKGDQFMSAKFGRSSRFLLRWDCFGGFWRSVRLSWLSISGWSTKKIIQKFILVRIVLGHMSIGESEIELLFSIMIDHRHWLAAGNLRQSNLLFDLFRLFWLLFMHQIIINTSIET